MKTILCCAFLTLALAGRAAAPIEVFMDTLAAEWMRADPEGATATQYFQGSEQDALDRQLTPITQEYRRGRVEAAERGLRTLKSFGTNDLTSAQRISAASLTWQLEDVAKQERFRDYVFIFQQFHGLQAGLVNFLSQTHPMRNRRDVENYLVRLEQVARVLDDGIAQARERGDRGFIPPKFILTATIDQVDRFLKPGPRQNVLVASLEERSDRIKELSAQDRAVFVATAEKTVSASIRPAFERIKALLSAQLPRATDEAGLGRFPEGAAAYRDALRRFTTSDLDAAQIHALGRKEIARIESKMDTLLRQLGYGSGTVQERMTKLEGDAQPQEADPRPRLLAEYTRIVRDAEKRCELLFDLRPRAPVEVKREPEFTEKNAAAHYTPPARDGSRPGTFWVPLPGPSYRMNGMRTLAYHEAVPGHHFQVALQQELTEMPRFRRDRVFGFLSAHGEGWALYAEQLAAESGWYEGDIRGQLGQLNDELFRARRLVVDTGLHSLHWTRQQAIDFGIPVSEVERYVVWPGQACAYKIGQLKILEVRDRAKAALGSNFSLKEFHNVVLRTGSVPLPVLETAIEDYVAGKRKK